MRYLRENKKLILTAMSLPVFFFFLDGVVVSFLKNHYINSAAYKLLEHLDAPMNFISHGVTLLTIAISLCLAGRFFDKKYYPAGKSLLVGFIASGLIVQILKHIVGRERPRLTDNLVLAGPSLQSGYDSFPSGHTTVAFCMAYILATHFPRYRVYFYFLATMIGLERVEGIAHFPSDVLAGAITGIVVAKFLLLKVFPSESRPLNDRVSESRGGFV